MGTNVYAIASNTEKFLALHIGNFRFLDSCQFTPSSLSELVENLRVSDASKFTQVRRHFVQDDRIDLMLRKGVYPYEHMTDRGKFYDTKLPKIDEFYSELNDSGISPEDYVHAENVWRTFGIQTMQEYHDLYLMTDVLLLADVLRILEIFHSKIIKLIRFIIILYRDSALTHA